MEELSLKLLGPAAVYHNGDPLRFRAKKALALLAYLATEGGRHRRDKLVDFLWPDSDEARGRAALRSALAGLRATLAEAGEPPEAPYLISEGDTLGLRFGPDLQIDLSVIEVALLQGPPADASESGRAGLRNAAEACRGEFMAGFSLDDAPEFDDWVGLEREAWRRRAGRVHARLARLELDTGQPEAAATTAARWLDQEPDDEATGALLMEARFALGNGELALEAYERVRQALAELGAEPGPTLEGLAASIRASSATRREFFSSGSSQGLPDLPLVGRAGAFATLVEDYRALSRGGSEARVVVVTGEAGMGKTRLVEEFLHWARAKGADVLRGAALETQGRLPYAPVVGALRPRLEKEHAPDNLLSGLWLAELSRVLPELTERLPDLPAPVADEAQAQARLFEAFTKLIGVLAGRAPVVLFLDDVQWADAGTLDLLRHAARRWTEDGAPVLLIASLRAEALAADKVLSRWLSGLVRNQRARHLELEALGGGDVSRLLEASADGTPSGDPGALARFGTWLFAETGGQPLFLTETLRALLDRDLVAVQPRPGGGWTLDVSAAIHNEDALRGLLPAGVQAVIRVRLSHLSPRAAEALSAGAVLGRQFGFEALLQVAGLGEDEGLTLLDEAQHARLVREVDAGEEHPAASGYYAFSHDKIRDVAYTEAGSARRRVLHRRALETLEKGGAPASELAGHALGAGLNGAAFGHLLAAGDDALAVFAVGDAEAYYERAQALFEETGRKATLAALPSEAEHLYVNLGRARELAERWEEASKAYEALRDHGRASRSTRLEWVALNRLAILAVLQSQDLDAASSFIREALAVAVSAGDRIAAAETEWNLAQMAAALNWRPGEAITLGRRALGVAQELGDRELAAKCLTTLSFAYSLAGRWDECVTHAREGATLYQTFGDRPAQPSGTLAATFMWAGLPASSASANRAMECLCLSLLASGETNLGEPGSGEKSGRRALDIALELNNPSAGVSAAMILHFALSDVGKYEEALRVARDAVETARGVGTTGMGSTGLFLARLALGRALQAVLDLNEAQDVYLKSEAPDRLWGLGVLSGLCAIRGLMGDWGGAAAHAKAASASRQEMPARLIAWEFGRHHEVEALLRGGDEALAREEVGRLGESLGGNRRFRLVYLRMQAVLARWDGRLEEALGRLHEAAALADEIGLPGESWEIHAAIGDLQNEQGEHGDARAAVGRAAETVLALAERIKDEKLREGFLAATPVQRVLARWRAAR